MHSIYVHSKKLKQKKWYFIKPLIKIIFFSPSYYRLPLFPKLLVLSSSISPAKLRPSFFLNSPPTQAPSPKL